MPQNKYKNEGGTAPGDPTQQGGNGYQDPNKKNKDGQKSYVDPILPDTQPDVQMVDQNTDPFADPIVTGPDTTVHEQYKDGQPPPPEVSPEDQLRASLTGMGYDRARIEELVGGLLPGEASSIKAGTAVPPKKAVAGTAEDPNLLEGTSLDKVLADGSGLEIGDTSVHQREVQDEELVSNQLNSLISDNSQYIQIAKQRAMEMANARGQLGSSFATGAATKAAIEAALPIAQNDAQAYRDAATQNLNALNEMSLANLQRATQLDVSILDANTRTSIANLDAETRTNLANLDAATRVSLANLDAETRVSIANLDAFTSTNIANLDAKTKITVANMTNQTQLALGQLQSEVQLMMQDRQMGHEVALEIYRQDGRLELANLDAEVRERLAQAGFTHDMDMNNLDHEQTLIVNDIVQGYELERQAKEHSVQQRLQQTNMFAQAQANYINYITGFAGTDMDTAAAGRLQQDAWNNLVAEASLINSLFPELDPIIPTRASTPPATNPARI